VQGGLVAVVLFVALMLSQLLASYRLPTPKRHLLQGVVAAMAVGCLMNSFLFDSHPGHFYGILSAILTVSMRPCKVMSTC
jgi:O-antigen ligase